MPSNGILMQTRKDSDMTTRTTALADGVLENRGGQQVLCFQRHLAHPITRVWAALTDPTELLG
jgi:hypothetical protein